MRWVVLLIGIFSMTGCVTPQPLPQEDPNFTSESGGFSVWMPVSDIMETEVQIDLCADETGEKDSFFARGNEAYWLVQYCDLPSEYLQQAIPDDLINQVRDDALADTYSRQVTNERDIELEGYGGREVTANSALRTSGMEFSDGTFKARIYLVENRIYLLTTYVFNENLEGLDTMDPFLQSFVLNRNK